MPFETSFAKIASPAVRSFSTLVIVFNGLTTVNAQTPAPPKALAVVSVTETPGPAKAPWGRVVMIGASVTAGFTFSEPFGGTNTPRYRLSRYVDAALNVPHEPVRNLGNSMLFLQPEPTGQRQIDQAIQAQPTLVLGVDFLFWFCYGNIQTNEDRLDRFEKGLKLLEKIPGPLVIGDIPDASAAANGMLSPAQIPTAEIMSAANRRLKEWAKARPQVVIVPLSDIMRASMANKALTVHNHTWPKGQTRDLLQDDQLHPSPRGCVVLALAALDAFQSTRADLPKDEVRWDPEAVYQLGLKLAARVPPGPTKLTVVPAPAGE